MDRFLLLFLNRASPTSFVSQLWNWKEIRKLQKKSHLNFFLKELPLKMSHSLNCTISLRSNQNDYPCCSSRPHNCTDHWCVGVSGEGYWAAYSQWYCGHRTWMRANQIHKNTCRVSPDQQNWLQLRKLTYLTNDRAQEHLFSHSSCADLQHHWASRKVTPAPLHLDLLSLCCLLLILTLLQRGTHRRELHLNHLKGFLFVYFIILCNFLETPRFVYHFHWSMLHAFSSRDLWALVFFDKALSPQWPGCLINCSNWVYNSYFSQKYSFLAHTQNQNTIDNITLFTISILFPLSGN